MVARRPWKLPYGCTGQCERLRLERSCADALCVELQSYSGEYLLRSVQVGITAPALGGRVADALRGDAWFPMVVLCHFPGGLLPRLGIQSLQATPGSLDAPCCCSPPQGVAVKRDSRRERQSQHAEQTQVAGGGQAQATLHHHCPSPRAQ